MWAAKNGNLDLVNAICDLAQQVDELQSTLDFKGGWVKYDFVNEFSPFKKTDVFLIIRTNQRHL